VPRGPRRSGRGWAVAGGPWGRSPCRACGRVSWAGRRAALGEGGGLALAGAGGLVELAAEAVVLSLQVVEASLKGLAAGTGDGVHTPIIGEALASAALPRPGNRNQLALDALIKYLERALSELHLRKRRIDHRKTGQDRGYGLASQTCEGDKVPVRDHDGRGCSGSCCRGSRPGRQRNRRSMKAVGRPGHPGRPCLLTTTSSARLADTEHITSPSTSPL
jgi:hypothetical protein